MQCILLYQFIPFEELKKSYTAGAPSLTFPAFAASVAFLVTFRNSFSTERYHDGRLAVNAMSASMYTAAAYAISFDKHPNKQDKHEMKNFVNNDPITGDPITHSSDDDDDNAINRKSDLDREKFRDKIAHAMSLLHGVCLQYLRCDWDLHNLSKHNKDVLPAWESGTTPGFKIHIWNYCLPRNRVVSRKLFHKVSKIQIIGGVSRLERHLLSLSGVVNSDTIRKSFRKNRASLNSHVPPTKESESASLLWESDNVCKEHTTDLPYRLFYATIEVIRRRFEAGGIAMPSPVIAQIWRVLDYSMQKFELCRSISETPFPFPWAQLIVVVLVVWQVVIPFTVIVSFNNQAFGVVMGMSVTWALWALNEVARDIEDPFTYEPNDIPLARLQHQFNERLLAVATSHEEEYDDFGWHANDMSNDDDSPNEDEGEENGEDIAAELPGFEGGLKTSASDGLV